MHINFQTEKKFYKTHLLETDRDVKKKNGEVMKTFTLLSARQVRFQTVLH